MSFPAVHDANVHTMPFPVKLELMRWIGRQTWVPKGTHRLLCMLQNPDRASDYLFEVDFFGLRYRGNLNQYLDWMVFCYGSYEYPALSLLEDIASILRGKKGALTYFDIGANLGHHVLFMAPRADRVVAFEPNPESLKLIRDKITLNNLSNVAIVPVGLGCEDSTLEYHVRADCNSGAGTFCAEDQPGIYSGTLQLPIRKGDSLCEEMGFSAIDLMKVDVEGFESDVLCGLAQRIHQDRPVILTELSDRSRAAFGNEQALRNALYPAAVFAEVSGRSGCRYQLRPFDFAKSQEVLIVPPEMAEFVAGRMRTH